MNTLLHRVRRRRGEISSDPHDIARVTGNDVDWLTVDGVREAFPDSLRDWN